MERLHAIEHDESRRALRRASRWFAVGIVLAPVLEVVDDAGVLTGGSALDARAWLVVLGTIAPFVGIAVAAAMLLARLRRSDRTWFFAACVAVLGVWLVHTGLRAPGVAALVCVAFAFVQMRAIPDTAA